MELTSSGSTLLTAATANVDAVLRAQLAGALSPSSLREFAALLKALAAAM